MGINYDLLCGRIFTLILLFSALILLSSDVQINPGPLSNFTFNIGHINARSLNDIDKFEEIVSMVIHHKLGVFAVSESWLNNSISSDLFNIPGFSPMFRLDRSDSRKAGGVALFTSLSIVTSEGLIWSGNVLKFSRLKCKLIGFFYAVHVCYRPPNSNQVSNIALLDYLQFCLDQIYLKPNAHVLLIGDFNAHYDI